MSETKTPVSGASSYRELGEYWDRHDLAEVWDATRDVELEVDLRSERRYVSLEPALSRRVGEIARTRGVSPETLVNLWVQEKVGEVEPSTRS
jgi:hypothetical protein